MSHQPMSIVELLDRHPALFYPQSWYRGESFTRILPTETLTPPRKRTHVGKWPNRFVRLPRAVDLLNAYVINPTHANWYSYYPCCDRDGAGQQVYIGKGYDGKGLMEIHRRTEINDHFAVAAW